MSGTDPLPTFSFKKIATLSWNLLTKKERWRVALLTVAMVINGALQTFSLAALIPFIGVMLDPSVVAEHGRLASVSHFFGNPDPSVLLAWCALALFAAIVIKNVFDMGYNYALNRLVAAVEKRVSVELLGKCMAAPYEWFLSRNTGLLVKAVMGDVVSWGRAGLKSILAFTSSAITIGSIFILLVSINPLFGGGLALAGGLVAMGILKGIKPTVRRLAGQKHRANDEAIKVIHHALPGIKDIKINGRERFFVKQFANWQQVFVSTDAKLVTLQPVPSYVIEIMIALILVVVGLIVSRDISLRAEMASLLAIYGVAIIRMVPVFNQMSGTINTIHSAVPAIRNVYLTERELAVFDAHAYREQGDSVAATWDRITVNDVMYQYPTAQTPALDGTHLVIERGLRVGIVGHSGAGKTTLVDILSGLLLPTSGEVFIGGQRLHADNAAAWRQQIGYVPQQPFIVDETLRFNVALDTDAKADDEKIWSVLEAANLGDVVRRNLRDGLDTSLGERGVRLSGGQRQRVAIARALYRDPSLLILDEATSSLDAESENAISSALDKISRDKTICIIAHRLSTVKNCDLIVVMEHGRVVGSGTHVDLIESCSLYRRFVELGDLSSEDGVERRPEEDYVGV